MDSIYYVYEHLIPDTNTVFYVGKGKLDRSHQRKGRNEYWKRTVKKHNGFDIRFVAKEICEELAFLIEIERISQLKFLNASLCNMTEGGEGSGKYWLGKKRSDLFKSKMRDVNLGKKLSDSTKQKLRDINTGKKLSEDTKNKLKYATSKAVLCIENDLYFNSCADAADHFGVSKYSVASVCNGNKQKLIGLHFKYVDKRI